VPAVSVVLTGALSPTQSSDLQCEGRTVGEVLEDCCRIRPALRSRIFRADGTLWVSVFVNGRSINQREGLETPVVEGDEVRVMSAIAGG